MTAMSRCLTSTGVFSADEVVETAEWIASLQLATGMIPWFPGGHCDPWNHVETAMALDVAGLHAEAERGLRVAGRHPARRRQLVELLPARRQRRGGQARHQRVRVRRHRRVAPLAVHVGPGLRRSPVADGGARHRLGAVDAPRRRHGDLGVHADDRPWNYALLTGSSSIAHALRCGASLARADQRAAARLDRRRRPAVPASINEHPRAFEPKDRWAMDWYYPVLTGCLTGERAKVRLADGWDEFAMEGKGIRCVSDEPWITASETAECAIAHAAIGDLRTATDLVRWTRRHRRRDGAYYTGIVYPAIGAVPVRRGLRVHRRRRDPGRRRDRRARHRPAACSCRAAISSYCRLADGPAATAQLVGQQVGRESADQQSLRRVERVGLLDNRDASGCRRRWMSADRSSPTLPTS